MLLTLKRRHLSALQSILRYYVGQVERSQIPKEVDMTALAEELVTLLSYARSVNKFTVQIEEDEDDGDA